MSARTIEVDGFEYGTTAPPYRAVQHGLKGWCVERNGERVSAYHRHEANVLRMVESYESVAALEVQLNAEPSCVADMAERQFTEPTHHDLVCGRCGRTEHCRCQRGELGW